MNLPQKYQAAMKELLKEEYPQYLESLEENRYYGLRINTLKISVEDFMKISPFELEPVPWIENGFYYKETDKPAKHPYYFAGLYYIQEPSAMTPANRLPVIEGDKVFDMCAAPGGKSTELGVKLNRSGLLVTNDISNSRAKALLKNLELFGIPNLMVLSEEPQKLLERYRSFFDKILIDAPCSGEGMFRKDSKLIKSWEKNGPEFYHKIQKELLLTGADMLKPGGLMLYSTCTFSQLEDEQSIACLLDARPDFSLVDIRGYEGFEHGFTQDDTKASHHFERTVRIWPHKMKGEGHFLALLQKSEHPDESDTRALHMPLQFKAKGKACKPVKLPEELLEFLKDITFPIELSAIQMRGEYAYLLPSGAELMTGLRTLRSGLLLGVCKKSRFEPSQALAMALKKDQYVSSVNFSAQDENVIRYLKGETLDLTGYPTHRENGWQLVCVDGYPLGWGKKNGTTLKNKYFISWRMM